MHKFGKAIALSLLSITSLSFAAKPNQNLVLVSEGAENGYEDYKIFVDKSSIKKIKNNKVLFNLITSGLSLDETITHDEPKVSENVKEFENQDQSQVVIVSEMTCNSKELKPIKYIEHDQTTGKSKERNATVEQSDDNFEKDDPVLINVHKLVC